MKRNDLFEIILKVYGIWLFMSVFTGFITMLLTIIPEMGGYRYSNIGPFEMMSPYFITLGGQFAVALVLVFYSKKIVHRIFRKDKDIELKWKVSTRTLLQIALIVIGGMFLLEQLSGVGTRVIGIWQAVELGLEPKDGEIPLILWQITLMISGYAIITASPKLANFLAGKIPTEKLNNYKAVFHKVVAKKRKARKAKIPRSIPPTRKSDESE